MVTLTNHLPQHNHSSISAYYCSKAGDGRKRNGGEEMERGGEAKGKGPQTTLDF